MSFKKGNKHRFIPGESGNKTGRPKGSRNLRTVLEALLTDKVQVAICKAYIDQAKTGNVRAIESIFDRLCGKVASKENIEHKNTHYRVTWQAKPISELQKEATKKFEKFRAEQQLKDIKGSTNGNKGI